MARLTRERDEAREDQSRQRERLATIIDEAWGMQPCMPTDALLTELERRLHADYRERARLRAALRLAEGPIAIAASYADQPCETMGMRVHAKDCARVLPEIHAALAGEGEAKRCAWTYDETHFAWDSSCGKLWILMDGGPSENEIRFCHGCGKPVEVVSMDRDGFEMEVRDA